MQGYFFSKPLPADELSKFLDNLDKTFKGKIP
jgi:EAL domain-containing protein (putative c-di-GMP-specific phosphodiesterase class I)